MPESIISQCWLVGYVDMHGDSSVFYKCPEHACSDLVGTDHHVSDSHVTRVCFRRDAGVGAKFTELL